MCVEYGNEIKNLNYLILDDNCNKKQIKNREYPVDVVEIKKKKRKVHCYIHNFNLPKQSPYI